MSDHALSVHEDDDGPSLRHRWFDPRTMEPPLRALTLVVLAQMAVAAVMMVLRETDLCALFASAETCTVHFFDMRIQLPNYLLAYASLMVSLTLCLLGLAAADLRGAIVFFGALLAIYVIGIFGFFNDPFDKLSVVLLVFMWMAIIVGLPKAHEQAYSPERRHPWIVWGLIALGVVPIALMIAALPTTFALLIILLRIPLAYIFVLAGTDWAEIGDAFLRWRIEKLEPRRRQRVLYIGAVAAALAVTLGAAIVTGYPVVYRIPAAVIALLVLSWVLRRAGFQGDWRIEFPWAALALLVIGFNLLNEVFLVNFVAPYSPVGPLPLWPSAGVAALGLGLAAAAALIRAGRESAGAWLAPTLLYGVILGLTFAIQTLPIRLDGADMAPPYTSLFFVFGAGSLGGLAWLYPRRDEPAVGDLIRSIFLFNAGLIMLYLLVNVVYALIHHAGESGPLVAAAVVVVALLWDLFTSGHSITNIDGRWFPRRSRVLLFFGFMMLAVAVVLFWGSLVDVPEEHAEVVGAYVDMETLVQNGIAELGPSLLFTLFVLRFGRWRAGRGETVAAPVVAQAGQAG